jgi:NitT/TauT family transport system substrate-binding protein
VEIDLHPERYKHYHLQAVPEQYRDHVDVRAFGIGERIVFLPYSKEAFTATREWTQRRNLLPEQRSLLDYDGATLA